MCGFALLGQLYAFCSQNNDMCLCNGLYGFITQYDEYILFNNESKHIKDCFNQLSDNLRDKYLIHTHNKVLPYNIIKKEDFIIPSF
jgi:hypothetical protein